MCSELRAGRAYGKLLYMWLGQSYLLLPNNEVAVGASQFETEMQAVM